MDLGGRGGGGPQKFEHLACSGTAGVWGQKGQRENRAFPAKAEKLIFCQKLSEQQVDDSCRLVDCVVRP